MSRHSKVIAQTDRQTDRQTDTQTYRQYENITFPHTWAYYKVIVWLVIFLKK